MTTTLHMDVNLELFLTINLKIQQLKKYEIRKTTPITWIFF